jgi:hypothetical protein
MRALGWLFVGVGLMIAIAYPVNALRHGVRRVEQWHDSTLKGATAALYGHPQIRAHIGTILGGLVPRWAQVSPWRGLLLGAGVSAVGILILTIWRQRRWPHESLRWDWY